MSHKFQENKNIEIQETCRIKKQTRKLAPKFQENKIVKTQEKVETSPPVTKGWRILRREFLRSMAFNYLLDDHILSLSLSFSAAGKIRCECGARNGGEGGSSTTGSVDANGGQPQQTPEE
ncbi:hypothetical protein Salat_1942400 [Sesamum alatum]|uniref:Uncharacterized protein n=1 Tax=Sesamum alatum TaxID=300844 RepID=A0AAE1Y4H7_9LAMI|nr:hypothetical protein Salat_1942400 [Sesamum alatum]